METNILVVDDLADNLHLLVEMLRTQGYKVRPALNGSHALSAAREHPPDLILLDIIMPDMDGYQVCEQLKADECTRDIPIIFLSALHESFDKVKAFSSGGVDYITKPFHPDEALARVRTQLSLRNFQKNLERLVKKRTAALQREIAEHEQTESALLAEEKQYRSLIEQTTDGIGIVQAERVVYANNALGILLDCPQHELIGRSPLELFRGLSRPQAENRPDTQESTGNDIHQPIAEFTVTQRGKEIWLEERHSRIQWKGKTALLIVMRDISAVKRREQELREEREQLRKENIRLRSGMKERYRFGKLIGKSLAMQEVYELIARASSTDANVVIYGESGTGKDLIAQSIHEESQRRKKPFIAVNCGSVQENLFEREFFGHRKGSFTGALNDHPGLFDAAHKGTLFLDEIGELTPAMQIKLLRAIENNGYTPLGAQQVKHADVRIIAATNRNLKEQVKQGQMREDFFYRINVIPIEVPPLRERKEDIPLLVEHFLQQSYEPDKTRIVPGKILDALYMRDWPGNIRQLQNALQRYLTLQRLDFDDDLHEKQQEAAHPPHMPEGIGLQTALEQFEQHYIGRCLAQNNGHKGKTAEMLEIDAKTLYRRIKKYRIDD